MKRRLLTGQIDGATEGATGEAPETLDRPVRCVYEGTFQSMDGEVTLTPADIDALATNHNAKITALGSTPKLTDYPPLQLDHSESAHATIGRLVGALESKAADVPGVGIVRCLFGTARFIGKENTQRALDGRFGSVSVGIDLDGKIIDELSIVAFPAAPHAALLSKGRLGMKPEHLKHYLTSCKGMSEDDALKHMGGLDEEGRGKLEAECKEHLKKLGVEQEEGATPGTAGTKTEGEQGALAGDPEAEDHLAEGEEEEPKDEKGKKEFARRKKQRAALSQAREQLRLAHLELRKNNVKARLAQLKADAKVTPAEIKVLEAKRFGAKKVALHELDEVAIDAIIGSLEIREPVIPTTHLGSVRGVDLANMGEAMKKQRLAAQEAETLSNMPFTRMALANTREAEGSAGANLAAGNEPAKVIRLMTDDGYQPPARVEDDGAKQEAEEALKNQQALSAQMQSLSTLVSTLESTI